MKILKHALTIAKIIKERELDNMEKEYLEKLQEELLEEINNDESKINNLHIYDANVHKINLRKFAQNDRKFSEKVKKGEDIYFNYLVTMHDLDDALFNEKLNELSEKDLEFLRDYYKKQGNEEDITIVVKVKEKKK